MPDASAEDEQELVDHRDGADAWLTQAQWLYEEESRHLNGIRTRATALIAISGAILAILARQQPSVDLHGAANAIVLVASVSAVLIFLLCAAVASTTLWGMTVSRPSHAALRREFRRWREEAIREGGTPKRAVFLQRDFSILLFDGEADANGSPLSTISAAAAKAIGRFHFAAGAFVAGLGALGVSIVTSIIWR